MPCLHSLIWSRWGKGHLASRKRVLFAGAHGFNFGPLAARETAEFFDFIAERNKECLGTSRIQKHVKNRREVPEKYTRNRKSKHCDAVTEDSKGTNQAWRCTCLCFRTILKCDELCSSVIQAVRGEIAEVNKNWQHFVIYFVHFLCFVIFEMFVSEERNISKCVCRISMKFCMVVRKCIVYILSTAFFEKQKSFVVIRLMVLVTCPKTTKNMRKIGKKLFIPKPESFQKTGLTGCRYFIFLYLCRLSVRYHFTLGWNLFPQNGSVRTCLCWFPWQRQTVAMKWAVLDFQCVAI